MSDFNSKESHEEDIKAIKSVLKGESSAFRILQDKYSSLIAMLIRKMIRNEDDVQDLTQETFIKAFKALHTFKLEYSFSAWIYRIASNSCIDFLRKRRFNTISLDQPIYDSDSDYFLQVEDSSNRPDIEVINKERKVIINNAIDNLPDNYQEIIRLRHELEMDYNEIAKELDMPLGTVKAHLYRARKLLYSELKSKRHIFLDA